MRALIRNFDSLLRRALGVFEFCDERECLFRLQLARASHDLCLSDDAEVRMGERVLMLHLWNEHVPPMGPAAPDLAWAVSVHRMLIHSLHRVAHWLAGQGALADVRAIGSVTVLILPGGNRGSMPLMRRLGFDVLPYRNPLGRFGEFWENLYTWGLMWTFNEASLRHRSLLRLRRAEMWMPADKFVQRYG